MPQPQRARRRTASVSSSSATAANRVAVNPTVVVSTKLERRDGNATPRQTQRAALRVATAQGKDTDDCTIARTERNNVSSGGVTMSSISSNSLANPQSPIKRVVHSSHAVATQATACSGAALPSTFGTATRAPTSVARIADSFPEHISANVCSATPAQTRPPATLLAKPVRRHTTLCVAPRRCASRNSALSQRRIAVGTTLVTPPPAVSISFTTSPTQSPRGIGAVDGMTPRGSSSVNQDVRRSLSPGPSLASIASSSQQYSSRGRDSGVSNNVSYTRNQTVQASLMQDDPHVVKVAPPPSPGHATLLAQQLLDEGYYLVSDGSANSSFSDTPRSARPASFDSTSSRRTSTKMLNLNSGRQARVTATGAAPPSSRGVVTPRQTAQHESSDGCAGDRSRSSSDADFNEEDDGNLHYDEEDEEQAVLTYMDSGAEVSYNRRRPGSGDLALSPPPRQFSIGVSDTSKSGVSAVRDGDEPDHSVDLGAADKYDGADNDDPPSRLSLGTPPLMYRRGTSTPRNSSLARAPRPPTPTSSKSTAGGGMHTPPHASSALPAKSLPPPQLPTGAAPATLSRPYTTASTQPSSRRSPHNRPVNQSPLQRSPLSPSALPMHGTPASADEELLERQCKHLSLHEAFFFNQSRSFWLVDDQVLAKVLEYVRLMGYEHPALRRHRRKGQASIWSSSSAIRSPITAGKQRRKLADRASVNALKELNGKVIPNPQTSPSAAAAAIADAVSRPNPASTSAIDSGAKEANSSSPYAFLGKQFHLKSGKPRCAGHYANTTSPSATHLFLTFNEALRWIVEQEYVIGTVLMCCARFVGDAEADGASIIGDGTAECAPWNPRRAMLQRGKPCIPVRLHPVHFVASLVLTHYPQWGGMATFMRTWETQIRLVLGTAAPSHQRVFKCPDDGLTLSSDLEAGNLHRVERTPEPYSFLIWLEPDSGSDKRIWFRFSVTGARGGCTLHFRLMNAAPHAKLYRQNGMVPVWRDGLSQVNWGPVDSCSFRTTNHDLDGEVLFSIQAGNSTETIQVAFCAPYSYADLLCHVCHWHALVKNSGSNVRFEERVLCRSPEGRKLHLLIVTSCTGGPTKPSREVEQKGEGGGSAPGSANTLGSSGAGVTAAAGSSASGVDAGGAASLNLTSPVSANASSKAKNATTEAIRGPYSNFASGKKVILVSGRVHPGEVTASHGVHGLISFLFSSEPRAIQLREHFVFFIVPMLNPDGVSRGHSRLDQFGSNLNRCYNDPDPGSQPTVHALRCVFEHLQRTYRERFIMYLDFHSHASQSSGFMFGNHLPVRVQHWNVFFPRLVELHARHVFSFDLCRFGRVHMTSKDGASRVLFGSSLIHSYTVELTHFTDRRLYADDFTAMNNGSEVLFGVTWPLLQPPPGLAAGNDKDEAENGKGGSRGLNGARTTSRASPLGLGGRGGKRSNSSVGRPGKSQPPTMAATAPHTASGSAGVERNTAATAANGKDEATADRKRLSSVSVGERGARGQSRDSVSASASPLRPTHNSLSLQPVSSPSVLCQSAEVGKACLLALLDYCSIGRPSDELNMFGGMSRVLRVVKSQVKAVSALSSHKSKKSQAAATYAGIQPIYKQY